MKVLVGSFLVVCTMTLTGCVTTEMPAESQHYNPEHSARIRLFGQNGKPTIMTVQSGQGADAKSVEINVGGGIGDAFGSMLGMSKNDGIGIPQTESTRSLADQNGILSKAFYREFVIPANKSVQVNNAYIGLATAAPALGPGWVYQEGSCTSKKVSFVPRAGKDYEVDSYKTGNGCYVVVFEVRVSDGKTALVPVKAN